MLFLENFRWIHFTNKLACLASFSGVIAEEILVNDLNFKFGTKK